MRREWWIPVRGDLYMVVSRVQGHYLGLHVGRWGVSVALAGWSVALDWCPF